MDKNVKYAGLIKILSKSKINHKIEILKESIIKDAHIYCKINNLYGQLSGIEDPPLAGTLIEYFIKIKYDMKINNVSLVQIFK